MFDRQYLNIHSFGPQCNSQAATENHHIFPALIITITLRYHAQWLVWPAMGLHDPSIYQRVTLMKLKFSPLRYNQWKIEENMFTHCTFGYDACTDDEFKRHTFNENERFGGWICSGAERESAECENIRLVGCWCVEISKSDRLLYLVLSTHHFSFIRYSWCRIKRQLVEKKCERIISASNQKNARVHTHIQHILTPIY